MTGPPEAAGEPFALPGPGRPRRFPGGAASSGFFAGAVALAAALLAGCAETGPPPPAQIGPAPEYADLAADLGDFIVEEMEAKRLPGLALALTDGDRIVWAQGFGEARPGVPADADTLFRVGSVSKLFTDLAVVALHERGALDLDAPIGDSLPGFAPAPGPEGAAGEDAPITLRQLMAHRAGLVREPPVGHYFDDSSPSLRATVESLNGVPPVFPPGERQKYSNAGIAVVGRVLEVAAGKPFAEAVTEAALAPLGLDSSSFDLAAAPAERLANATMWSYDGREFAAPTFPLGMAPAGSLVTSVRDLGRFLTHLAGGALPGVVSADGLREMWRVQFPEETAEAAEGAGTGVSTGFGLGFHLAALESGADEGADEGGSPERPIRLVGHGGAIYGFSTELAFLPEAGLGAVAVANVDFTNAVVGRIVRETLLSALARRNGQRRPPRRRPEPLPAGLAARLHGPYETDDGDRLRVLARGDRAEMEIRSATVELAQAAPGVLIVDSRLAYGPRIEIGEPDDERVLSLRLLGRTYRRVPDPLPAPAPEEFRPLLGEYGWDHNLLFVFEREGALTVLIEWLPRYALTPSPAAPDCFDFPDAGLYPGESLCFLRDEAGGVTGADLSGIVFPRRPGPGDAGGTFRIEPLLPVSELRARAEAASPPVETGDFREDDLVRLTDLDPGIRLDVRYASTNNFMGTAFYEIADAFLQRPAAEALARANAALGEHGYAALVYDGYRPWRVTKMFHDATPEHQRLFVADPADGSRHNRGAAVDLGLVDRETGEVLEFVSGYDEFSERAFPGYVGGTSRQRWRRELLRRVMEREGFTVYEHEWWHFDYRDWQRYRLLDVPLVSIGAIGSDGR